MKYLLTILLVLMCSSAWGGEVKKHGEPIITELPGIVGHRQYWMGRADNDSMWIGSGVSTDWLEFIKVKDSEGRIHKFKPVVVEDCIETGWYEIVDGMGNRSFIRQAEEPCKKYHRLEWQHIGAEDQ